jgi:hypothetical protein
MAKPGSGQSSEPVNSTHAKVVCMALLTGPPELRLELTPLRYQYPGNNEPWDADWLTIQMRASDRFREWESIEPVFLTFELRSLVVWLRALAAGSPQVEARFDGTEPNLQFEAVGTGAAVGLKAIFELEFRPPGFRHEDPLWDTEVAINFSAGRDGLNRFADQLEAELEQFPVRRPLTPLSSETTEP